MANDLIKRMVADIPIFSFDEVNSTQDIAKDLIISNAIDAGSIGGVIAAKHQTQGRGRLDRTWESKIGSSLLTTFIVKNDGDHPFFQVGSILISLVEVIEKFNANVNIKWPNDVVFDLGDKYLKLAGCLTELYDNYLLVGIGINLNEESYGDVKNCTSISQLGIDISFDSLLDEIVSKSKENVGLPLNELKSKYESFCSTLSKHVRVERAQDNIDGIATSINDLGHLIIDTSDKEVEVSEGDVIHLRFDG